MTSSKVTLADVAKEAGVSTSTVSRALADSPLISDEVKEKIKAVAEQMDYQINLTARNLRLQRTGAIAVVIPIEAMDSEILSNPFVLEFLGAVGYTLRQFEYHLLLLRGRTVVQDLLNSGVVDGFIQLGHAIDPTGLNSIVARIPFVVWGPQIEGQHYASVGIDSRDMARQATQHLIDCGRKRIGIITGNFDVADAESHLRFAGYRAALDAAGIPYEDKLLVRSQYNPASGRAATQRLLQQAPDIDAIFVSHSDMVAMVSIEVLRGMGRNVPNDVAVIGFDNISMAEHLAVPLTTVSQEIQQQGIDLLVSTLMDLIKGLPPTVITTQGKLMIRQSSGCRQEMSTE